jgi:two-component system, LuxR family, sensor kinase FixL
MKRFYTVLLIALLMLIGLSILEGIQRMFAAHFNPWESSIIIILSAFAVASIATWITLFASKALRQGPAMRGTIFPRLNGVSGRDPTQLMLKILPQAVAQCPNSIIISDVKGKIEYVNQTFSRISGYTADEAVGRTPAFLKSGETPRTTYEELWGTILSGKIWRGELKNKRKDGRVYWDQLSIAPIKDDKGLITHFLGIQTDVTEHKTIQESLRESENRFSAIVAAAAEGILTIDRTGTIWSFNRAAEQMFDYRAEELIGKNSSQLLSPVVAEDKNGYIARYLNACSATVANKIYHLVGRRKDGSTFPMELTVSQFDDGTGPYYAVIVRDTTERKRMEAKLREEHKFTTAILASSGALIIVLDRQGRIVRFNRACEEVSGYAWEEVKYKNVWDLFIIAGEMAPVKTEFDRLREGRVPGQFENYWITRHGQRRRISWYNNALLDEEGQVEYIVSNGIDITDRRQAEEQARQHQAELAHMDRINLMGEMATGLAHELTQPLTSIYAYSQACLRMLKAGQEKSEKFANAIEQSAQRAEQAGKIIRRLRQFVRKQVIRKSWLSLCHLIEEALAFIKVEADENGVTTCLELDEELPPLFVDPVQIEQVMLNLMRNSIEAMAGADFKERILTVAAATIDSSSVQVTVVDTGPGLNEDQIKPIFDAFFTTKKNGMGMGLAISRSIIEAHGGRLWADSRHEKGASFHFNLPIAKGAGLDEP